MNKRNWFFGLSICVLVLGVLLASCASTKDTWSDLNSLDQLNGTWVGSYNQTMSMQEFVQGRSGEGWDDTDEVIYGKDMKVTESVEVTQTVDAGAGTVSLVKEGVTGFSGGQTKSAWEYIKFAMGSGSGVSVNDSKHSITITQAGSLHEEDIETMLSSGLQINQNGKKIKYPAGSVEPGSPEVVLQKK